MYTHYIHKKLPSQKGVCHINSMNLYIRFLWLLLKRIYVKEPVTLFTRTTYPLRVNVLDLDFHAHVNNGRYLTLMDLGRFDLLLRSKIFWKMVRHGYYAVVSSESIRFKKALSLFQKFDLITEVEAWDEKSFYIKQQFVCDGELYAEGYVKGCFRKRGHKGPISTKDVFTFIGEEYKEPHLTKLATLQKEIEKNLVLTK